MMSLKFLQFNPCAAAGLGAALLSTALSTLSADTVTYAGLKPDAFMKNWLILRPIPVAGQSKGTPSEETQKKGFAEDWLLDQGGEEKVQPSFGMKEKIGGQELAWERIESRTDIVNLKNASAPSDFVIAYAWAEI